MRFGGIRRFVMGNPFRRREMPGMQVEEYLTSSSLMGMGSGAGRKSFVVEHREGGADAPTQGEREFLWPQIARCGGFALVELCSTPKFEINPCSYRPRSEQGHRPL
jgi:hypothetical protein